MFDVRKKFTMATILVGCLLPGCAALTNDGTSVSESVAKRPGVPQASAAFRTQNHKMWVMRLKIADPIESLEGRQANPATSSAMPIPMPPTVPQQYALIVDGQQQLAWLRGNQIHGPFPVTNSDVTHLMSSISQAWDEQAAWQASMQQTAFQNAAQQLAMQNDQAPSQENSSQNSSPYRNEFSVR